MAAKQTEIALPKGRWQGGCGTGIKQQEPEQRPRGINGCEADRNFSAEKGVGRADAELE